MLSVGFVGWRGMVGSVLLARMRAESDLPGLEVRFFSTSNPGGAAPPGGVSRRLADALDLASLRRCDVVLSCQGGSYTARTYGPLRASGWEGYWIDAASALRMQDDATLILDPVNGDIIRERLAAGCRNFIGANCTVSLLLMAVGGLFKAGWVEWITTMTYQAVSGAGSRRLTELASQIVRLSVPAGSHRDSPSVTVEAAMTRAIRDAGFPTAEIGAPLACNVLPWIDRAVQNGQTREEWKASVEATKILGAPNPLRIDGVCARVDSLRCHSQALCIKLDRDVPIADVEAVLRSGNPWVRVVDNSQEATLRQLTPASVTGSLEVAIGRLRKLGTGPRHIGAFTVGDQLLWGAAEPLRRMLGILREAC